MSLARAEDGSTLELYPDTDNWAALQSFCDAHHSVQLPAGTWVISKALNLTYTVRGKGPERTVLRRVGTTGEPVLGVAGDGRWPSSVGRGVVNGARAYGMTLWQTDDSSANCKGLFHNGSNTTSEDFVGERLRVRGSAYEGFVTGSNVSDVTLRDIEAWDCGNGGAAFAGPTAGINCTSIDLLIEGFRTLRCAQGIETGNTRITIRRGTIQNAGATQPFCGINVGSSNYGIWLTTIEDVTIDGYDNALVVGPNGNGRLASVACRRLTIYDDGNGGPGSGASPIQFGGGIEDNLVPHADEGPDTGQSEISDCTIYLTAPHSGAIGYNSGIVDNGGLYGREPLLVVRNKVYLSGNESSQTAPFLYVAGRVDAKAEFYENEVWGTNASPSRGDLATFTLIDNPANPNMPSLREGNNRAYNTAGRLRAWTNRIEA